MMLPLLVQPPPAYLVISAHRAALDSVNFQFCIYIPREAAEQLGISPVIASSHIAPSAQEIASQWQVAVRTPQPLCLLISVTG